MPPVHTYYDLPGAIGDLSTLALGGLSSAEIDSSLGKMVFMAVQGGKSMPEIQAYLEQSATSAREPVKSLVASWGNAVNLPWETASQLPPDRLLVLVDTAFARRRVMDESEWNDFRDSAEDVVDRIPEDARAEVWAELGEDWYWSQETTEADNCLQKAKEYFLRNDQAERSIAAAQQIARLCEQLKDPSTEVEVLEDALAQHPDHHRAAATLNMLINTYVEMEDTATVHTLRAKLFNEFPRCRVREQQLLGLRLDAGLPLSKCSSSGKGIVQ